MKASAKVLQRIRSLATVLSFLAAFASNAATVSWTGASGTDTNWSNAANWSGGTPAGNDVKFFIAGAASATNTVNNVVDASVTVNSLQFANTNFFIPPTNAHTISIAAGQTLSITGSGGLTNGTLTDPGNTNYIYNSITGPGALYISNSAAVILSVQGRAANGNGTQRATLDLAGLDSFTANINRIDVGTTISGGANNAQNATGTILLARTNTITAAFTGNYTLTGAPITNSIEVGLNNGNSGGPNFLFLGASTTINADSIGVGKAKTTSSMLFNPSFTNNNPVATFRGASGGSSRVTFWSIGDMADGGSSSGTATGTNDFTGGSVDALVTTMSLGRDRSTANTGSGATRGILTFTAGTIDVNTLLVGNQFFSNPTNTNPMAGVVNINGAGATLKVNTSLVLASTASATSVAATNTTGTLNINGGHLNATVITSGAKSTNSVINLNAGRLTVGTTAGTAALPITSVNATNGTFTFTVAANRTNLFTKTLAASGTANTIDLAGVSGLGTYPTQIVLIKYTGALIGTFNFVLGNVPSGVAGHIEDNAVNSSVDLVLTAGPEPPTARTWTGAVNGNWDIAGTANWVNPSASPSFYFEGDFPLFNDSASGTTDVVLTTNVNPGSVTISNVTKSYTFGGPGGISGSTGLLKQGSGTVTILNTNTYTGVTTISNGVLQLGNGTSANGSISGNIANETSLIVANPAAQTLSSAITGAGSLTKSGAGTLTLSGTSTYTGGTLVSAGTLQVGNGATGGSITGNVTNNASLAFSRSDSSIFDGVISGTGTLVKSGSGTLILSATNTYAGGSTNSAGTLVLSNNAAIGTGTMVYSGGSVQLAPGVTVTNNFHVPSSTSDAMMDVSANGPAATWAGNITVAGGGQFRPAGIAGTLDLTGTGSFGGNFFMIPRGTVEIVSNANFSSTAACVFGRNTTGSSTFVRLKGNASVSLGSLNLGGGSSFATGGRMELLLQDNATLNLGTSDFDIHNSTVAAAVSYVSLNGGTITMGGQIKTRTGATQFSTNFFNGGKLRASKDNAAFLPASSGLTANVRDGGAIIDDNGFSIGIALPLLHSIVTGDNATDGGLTKLGAGTLTLSGANTYNGLTTVSNGTLRVDGSIAGAVTMAPGSTLGGSGTISGTVTMASPSTLAPGSSIGTLTVGGNLTLGGNLSVEVDKSVSPSNDLCAVTGTLTNTGSGFLAVQNLGPALALGDSFTLFNQPLPNGEALTITPAPGAGLAWSNRLAIDGSITVVPIGSSNYTERLYVATTGNQLLSFQNNAPGAILTAFTFTGLQPGEQIIGIDFVGDILYALGDSSRLYTINRNTGAATLVGQFTPVLNGSYFGLDIEPAGVRVLSELDQQLVLNPGNGAATVATTLVGGTSTSISGLAYHPGTAVRYVADYVNNSIGTLDPVTGVVTTIGPSGIDFSRHNGFDISAKPAHQAYMATPAASSDAQANLYKIDLTTGVATLVGKVGNVDDNYLVRGLAVGPEFSVASSVNATPTNLVSAVIGGTNLVLSWPLDHQGWTLQKQTNSRAIGLKTNWVDVSGSSSVTATNFPINKNDPTVFYRLHLVVP